MFGISRPDTTNEGWNTWPTEKVSHALVRKPRLRAVLQDEASHAVTTAPTEVALLGLADRIRDLVEEEVASGSDADLEESLLAYALSRVDWLQLAQSQIEATFSDSMEQAA